MAISIREMLGLHPGENLKTHRTYRIWYAMRQRCFYTKHHAWDKYGGRGIKVDERWHDFAAFVEDMGHPPSDLHSIDRIDNDGNYCKANCRWALPFEQNANRSTLIQTDEHSSLKALCAEKGLPYPTIWHRVKRAGMTVQQAINTPIRSYQNA